MGNVTGTILQQPAIMVAAHGQAGALFEQMDTGCQATGTVSHVAGAQNSVQRFSGQKLQRPSQAHILAVDIADQADSA